MLDCTGNLSASNPGRNFLAGTIQLGWLLALTLALSPWARERHMNASGKPPNGEFHFTRSTILLLLGGEGWDEGGRDSQLHRPGLTQIHRVNIHRERDILRQR
jgi:hypothetical protein